LREQKGGAAMEGVRKPAKGNLSGHGIAEDSVCGSGNISVAAYLVKTGQAKRVGERYTARQGMQLGRDGRVSICIEGGKIFLGAARSRAWTARCGSRRAETTRWTFSI
jgi:hypothetical protein